MQFTLTGPGAGAYTAVFDQTAGIPAVLRERLTANLHELRTQIANLRPAGTPEDWFFSSASWYECGGGPLRFDSTEELL